MNAKELQLLQCFGMVSPPPQVVETVAKISCCDNPQNIVCDMSTDYFSTCCVCAKQDPFPQHQLHFIQGKQDGRRPNQGFSIGKKRRYYLAFTNLKDHFYRYKAYSQAPLFCTHWNEGLKCLTYYSVPERKCNKRHRCCNCLGRHPHYKCNVDSNWKEVLKRTVDMRGKFTYILVKRFLKTNKLCMYYKHVFELIYELGGMPPKNLRNGLINSAILADMKVIYYFYVQEQTSDRKHSLSSALMILDFVLKINNVPSYYLLPALKSKHACSEVVEFIKRFIHQVPRNSSIWSRIISLCK